MKKLTYKIVKTVSVEDQKAVFDREHYITELKKEAGLPEVAYEDLGNYKIKLNSPTGRSSTFEVSAKEYIDNELANIEKFITDFNTNLEESESFDFVSIHVDEANEKMIRDAIEKSDDFLEWLVEPEIKPIEVPESHKKLMKELDEKLKYFHVSIGPMNYNVVTSEEDHNNLVRNHFTTVREYKKTDSYAASVQSFVFINYFQWVNLVTDLVDPRKKDDYSNYENIAERMDLVMDQIKGIQLPAGF